MWVALIVGDIVPSLSQLRWQVEGVLIFLMGCLAALICLWVYEVLCRSAYAAAVGKQRSPEVVLIEDSPPPTRSSYTPKPTPPSMRTLRARRAGRKRLPMVRRLASLIRNPTLPNHCAYECCLVALGVKPTMKNISALRQKVAEREKEAFITNTAIFGIQVRDYVEMEQQTLAAYLAAVKDRQWASIAEIATMCEITGWSVYVQTKEGRELVGNYMPKHIMKLKDSHYTLWKCRSQRSSLMTTCALERGGMRVTPTMIPNVISRYQVQQIECVFDQTFPTDVVHLSIRARPADGVEAFRRRLSEVLGCAWERIMLYDQNDLQTPLRDERDLCSSIFVRDAWYDGGETDNTYVEFNMDPTGEAFVLKCRRSTTHQQLIRRISLLTNIPEASIDLRSFHGEAWHFPASIAQTRVVVHVYRGGMHNGRRERSRSRSVTPTVPFTGSNIRTQETVRKRRSVQPQLRGLWKSRPERGTRRKEIQGGALGLSGTLLHHWWFQMTHLQRNHLCCLSLLWMGQMKCHKSMRRRRRTPRRS